VIPLEGDSGGVLRLLEREAFFDLRAPFVLARAPGRLDVMGGIGDYSGSLVLELPLAVATWVAVQRSGDAAFTCVRTSVDRPADRRVAVPMEALEPRAGPLDYGAARILLNRDPRSSWMAYVAGAVVALHHARGRGLGHGVRCWIHSEVPLGKGLSSSAAVEVAALQALANMAGFAVEARDLALLGQTVENRVVGAPCGVMDQMTAACGRRDRLLALRCQPAELEGDVAVPPEIELWGLDSGIRHSVSGSDYTGVRVGAFMGYRMVAEAAGMRARQAGDGVVQIDDRRFQGYLANVAPSEWAARFAAIVPETLAGDVFLARYQGLTDTVTRVDPARVYAVRACAAHPVGENHRVRLFRALLESGAGSEASRELLGELMFQSHASYGACGLGSDGTDRLVELAREQGPRAGIYGAKVTGGGSGGTVAVLARAGSRAAVEAIADRYRRETGREAALVTGSSDGAVARGVLRITP
jgi:L-arabinokinase